MTPLVLEPLRAAGAVPHLDRLLGQGASGVLRSTTHPLTPQAWTTMFTGVGAGRHGIWDFHERDESGYGLRPVNGSYRREPAVWQRLSAAGPPRRRDQRAVHVAGRRRQRLRARRLRRLRPARGLRDARRACSRSSSARFGPLVQDHAFPVTPDGGIDLDQVRRVAEQRVELTLWLAERFDPELLIVVFMAADHAHHLGWDEWERSGAASPLAQRLRDPRRGGRRARGRARRRHHARLRPRRRAAPRRRQPQRLAGRAGPAGVRGRGRADARRTAAAHGGGARARRSGAGCRSTSARA